MTYRRTTPQKPVIYPAGTQMCDVPPLAKGITWMEYLDLCIAKCPRTFPEEAPKSPSVPSRRRR